MFKLISQLTTDNHQTIRRIAREVAGLEGLLINYSHGNYEATIHLNTDDGYPMLTLSDYRGWYIQRYGVSVGVGVSEGSGITLWAGGYCQPINFTQAEVDALSGDDLTLEDGITKLFTIIRDRYRKPVSRGCVKAFLGDNEILWVSKRPNSDAIVKVGDKYFVAEGSSNFCKVVVNLDTMQEEWCQRYNNADIISTVNVPGVGRKFIYRSLLTPVYQQFDAERRIGVGIVSYILPSLAPTLYRSYEGEHGPVFTNEPLPYAEYRTKAVWNYSKRIENLLEPSDLFRLGKHDLYAKRDRDEVPFLGWELEACCNTSEAGYDATANEMRQRLDTLVMCKQDGSIRPTGFETVSVPATLDFWKEAPLKDGMDALRSKPFNMRSYEHKSCGFHVHVSRAALSVLDLQKIERFMHNPDNREFLRKVAGRKENTYANYNDNLFKDRKSLAQSGRGAGRRYPAGRLNIDPYEWREEVLRENRVFYAADVVRGFVRFLYSRVSFNVLFGNDGSAAAEQRVSWACTLSSFPSGRSPTYIEPTLSAIRSFIEREADESARYVAKAWEIFLGESHGPVPVPGNVAEVPIGKDAWKAGLRKSKLSHKRKDSFYAAQDVQGPVGKGRERYDVLNTRNQHTVEFRLFKGTMNADSIYRYLEFVDALVRFVPTTSACDDGLDYKKFIAFIINDSFNRMRYEHLVAFLVANGFVERKVIRRRELKEVKEEDNILNGVVVKVESNPDIARQEEEAEMMADDIPSMDGEYTDCGDPECDICGNF